MASAIDDTKPASGAATTASVRAQFTTAKSEISALQDGSGVAAGALTNAKLANMTASTIKGRVTASTGAPEDMTAVQARSIVEAAAPTVVSLGTNTTLTAASHQGKVLYCTAAISLTVNASTDFDALASCEIVAWGGVVTMVATATINRVGSKPLTIPQYGRAVLTRSNTTDVYLLTGEMA